MQTKNMGRARELLNKALELKPDFMQGRLWYARYLTQVDSLEEAIAQYDQVLKDISGEPAKYKKELAEISRMKAALMFQRGQYARVVDELKRTVALGVDDAAIRLTLGQALLQTLDKDAAAEENAKKIEESINDFRKSVTMDANSAQAHLWLGQALVMSRKEGDDDRNKQLVEEACGEFRKVLKIDPKNQDAKKSMERVCCK